jgi:hypothetical protein
MNKLSNRVPIQAPMDEGLSFLSPKPLDVGAPHPPSSLLTKLTSGANK